MILRVLTLIALVVSLAAPAVAKPLAVQGCPTRTAIEMCYTPQQLGRIMNQTNLELPCAAKALLGQKYSLTAASEREASLIFVEDHKAWTSQSFTPPERPPRI